MQFTLYYDGPLKSNADPEDKRKIRRRFHRQLKQLWQQEPLINFDDFLNPQNLVENTVVERVGDFIFAPLVCKTFHLVADIEILMMRPETPGSIITSGGDIDNRLKTLLDSLKIPREPKELPATARPQDDERPFFCLLQNDSLITRLSVETAQLLEPSATRSHVVLLLKISTVKLSTMMGGDDLP